MGEDLPNNVKIFYFIPNEIVFDKSNKEDLVIVHDEDNVLSRDISTGTEVEKKDEEKENEEMTEPSVITIENVQPTEQLVNEKIENEQT